MLAELRERDATGEIAEIYAEIRRLWAVPYVSSLQRHLATRPGWLPWTWAALGPAFASGIAQTAAWRAADGPRGPAAGAHLAGCPPRVGRRRNRRAHHPVSLRQLRAGEPRQSRPVGSAPAAAERRPRRATPRSRPTGCRPPPSAPCRRSSSRPRCRPPSRRCWPRSAPRVDGQPFVPGLYRMLASWPAFLAHIATVLRPHLADAATLAAGQRLLAAVDAEIPAVFAALPSLPSAPPMPPEKEFAAIRSALDTYRKTSPEMVVFGRMIGDALPAPETPPDCPARHPHPREESRPDERGDAAQALPAGPQLGQVGAGRRDRHAELHHPRLHRRRRAPGDPRQGDRARAFRSSARGRRAAPAPASTPSTPCSATAATGP